MLSDLAEIRDRRLWREHKSFQAFVQQEFGKSASWACRQIKAAEVRKSLLTNENTTPPSGKKCCQIGNGLSPIVMVSQAPVLSESQARELAKVPEEQREAVLEWAEEKAGDKPVTPAREGRFEDKSPAVGSAN